MSGAARLKLQAALQEAALHAAVLRRDLALLPAAFSLDQVCPLADDLRMVLDQAAYRFMKLQDSLGEKVLPGLLEETLDPLPPEASFAQKLQRLERLGALPSAEQWRVLREVRNTLAHEYPDNPALQVAALTRFRSAVGGLLQAWEQARHFAAGLGLPVPD